MAGMRAKVVRTGLIESLIDSFDSLIVFDE
jgi:hypothetical protein